MKDETRCKHTRRTGVITMHRCERVATNDGYCTRHHPSYFSPKEKAAYEKWEREEQPLYDEIRARKAADKAAAEAETVTSRRGDVE